MCLMHRFWMFIGALLEASVWCLNPTSNVACVAILGTFKGGDPADPMMDYEMDAYLSFQLREEDPAYWEDDDNIVTTRQHGMKNFDLFEMDWTVTAPPWLQTGSHCYLFHELYDHRDHFGGEERAQPWRPFRNCLRIGSVWADVTVLQQYEYEVPDEPGA